MIFRLNEIFSTGSVNCCLLGVFTWLLHIKFFDVSHVVAQGILEVPLGHMGADDVTATQHDGRGEHYHPPARKGKINCNCRTKEGRKWVDVQESQVVVHTTAAPSARTPRLFLSAKTNAAHLHNVKTYLKKMSVFHFG